MLPDDAKAERVDCTLPRGWWWWWWQQQSRVTAHKRKTSLRRSHIFMSLALLLLLFHIPFVGPLQPCVLPLQTCPRERDTTMATSTTNTNTSPSPQTPSPSSTRAPPTAQPWAACRTATPRGCLRRMPMRRRCRCNSPTLGPQTLTFPMSPPCSPYTVVTVAFTRARTATSLPAMTCRPATRRRMAPPCPCPRPDQGLPRPCRPCFSHPPPRHRRRLLRRHRLLASRSRPRSSRTMQDLPSRSINAGLSGTGPRCASRQRSAP